MGATLQGIPVACRDVPVDDGAIGLRYLTVGNRRCLHRVVHVDARDQHERPQNHSQKNPHGKPPVIADNAILEGWFHRSGVRSGRGRLHHERVFVVAGPAIGADAGAAVTMLSDFSSSGLNTNSLSCGVSMACTQTGGLTPMGAGWGGQRAGMFCERPISCGGGPWASEGSRAP